jgi:hypothetical protein
VAIPAGEDPDEAIIEQLRKAGLDLSSPFHIRYIFIATSEDSARQLSEELKPYNLNPEINQESSVWKVAVAEEVVLDESSMKAKRAKFSSLAGNFGGKYAGWELKTIHKTIQKTTFKIG